MPLIELSRGKYCQVDAEDKPRLLQYRWSARLNESTGAFYAVNAKLGQMSHFLLGKPPARTVVDHINGDTLDNRRSNLRFATMSQNNTNSKLRKDNTSGHRGVGIVPATGKWQAVFIHAGWRLSLGCFKTREEAIAAYRDAATKVRGDYVRADCMSIGMAHKSTEENHQLTCPAPQNQEENRQSRAT